MTTEQKRNLFILAGVGIAAWLLLKPTEVAVTEVRHETPPAIAPESGEWIPGQNNYQIVFGSDQPFLVVGGDTNIHIPDAMLANLSRQYIPMFGFVGVTAVGAL